jgi:predicted nucleotidyltransferase
MVEDARVVLSEEILNEAIRRIVGCARPRKIILFGSAARGEMGPNSDMDLLVVIASGGHRRRIAQEIYRSMIGVGFAADVVVVTEEDLEEQKDNPGMVIHAAVGEGRVVYAA